MLPLVAGSISLDVTSNLFAHMLVAKASHKASLANGAYKSTSSDVTKDVYNPLIGVGRKQIAMNDITIYHRTSLGICGS